MKHLIFLLIFSLAGVFACPLKANEPVVTITTNVGVMKAKLYDNVPNHVKTFIERAKKGEYNGTLFTRVIKDFMIQGGAPDSRNASPGARVGFGDKDTEILPELRPEYFHKKGALAAPRQNDDVNPEKKKPVPRTPLSPELKGLVKDMQHIFATKVKAVGTHDKGRIYIDYYTQSDLQRIFELIERLK